MGHIYLYYGTGGGKTAASLGLALRSIAHGHRVVIIQFLKHWKETGEYKVAKTLGPLYEIRQFGKQGWLKGVREGDEIRIGGIVARLRKPSKEDKGSAEEALRYTDKVINCKNPPELLILDEICLAAHLEIIDTARVLTLLDNLPKDIDVVLTGRFSPQELIDRADFVNEIREVKAPQKFVTREGIQY